MKKIGLFTFLFLVAFLNNAHSKEIPQGTIEIAGDSSFSLSSSDNSQSGFSGTEETTSRSISLDVLYYVSPNIGVGALWSNEYQETDDGFDKFETNINMVAPMIGINVSLEETTSIQFYAAIILIGDGEAKLNGTQVDEVDISGRNLGARFKKFVSDSFSVNAGLSLSSLEFEDDFGSKFETDSTDIDVGLSVYF